MKNLITKLSDNFLLVATTISAIFLLSYFKVYTVPGGVIGLSILTIGYFLPSIIGINCKNHSGITLLNIFLGWTLIGWIIALIWSVSGEKEVVVESNK